MTLWRLAERHRVTYFGTSAPFVAACRKAGLTPAAELDLTSIGTIGSTGSPLSAERFPLDPRRRSGPDIQIASLSGGTDLCTARGRRRADRAGVDGRDLLPGAGREGGGVLAGRANR